MNDETSRGPMAWLADLTRGDKGPHATVSNAILALCRDRGLAGLLAFDTFANEAVILQAPPQPFDEGEPAPGPYPRRITDSDVTLLQAYMQRVLDIRVTAQVAHQAVETAADQVRFHPVRDWLDTLRWDGRPRIGSWLQDFLGAAPGPYTSAVGAMFLTGMVARVRQPGCKVDHMMVLTGPQGIGKSSALRALAGDGWFSDSLPNLRDSAKDVSLHLSGRWLVEIAELSSFGSAGLEQIKSFITRQTENFRPPYARREVSAPRQCVVVGTTNATDFLRDPTGGRRFWPVTVGARPIDARAIEDARAQIFAEADTLYRAGGAWWPDRATEARLFTPVQAGHQETDAWQEPIGRYLASVEVTTILQAARDALGLEAPRLGTREQRRIAAALEVAGWRRSGRPGGIVRWVRGAPGAPQ